jgi:hypothetical protein
MKPWMKVVLATGVAIMVVAAILIGTVSQSTAPRHAVKLTKSPSNGDLANTDRTSSEN